MNLSGTDYMALCEALAGSFDTDELGDLARAAVDVRLDQLVGAAAGTDQAASALVGWCERRNRVRELVQAAAELRPNTKVSALADRLAGPAALAADGYPDGEATRTVLDLDMVGYSTVARAMDAGGDAEGVRALNARIQRFVDAGLRGVGRSREHTVMAETGDGAILVFDAPAEAHRFAAAMFAALAPAAAGPAVPFAFHFRVGAATGRLVLERRPGGYRMAGLVIAHAVRLQTAAGAGTLLVDQATFDALPRELQDRYSPEEVVRGKRDETFVARRCALGAAPAAPMPPPLAPASAVGINRREVVELIAKISHSAKLDRLMFLLEMPVDAQPPLTLSHGDRQEQVLKWVTLPQGPGLARLVEEVRWLLAAEAG